MDAPEKRSFDWVIEETARVLAISPEAVELRDAQLFAQKSACRALSEGRFTQRR
jgi:hypothetical protein